jgi:hypothetical protein
MDADTRPTDVAISEQSQLKEGGFKLPPRLRQILFPGRVRDEKDTMAYQHTVSNALSQLDGATTSDRCLGISGMFDNVYGAGKVDAYKIVQAIALMKGEMYRGASAQSSLQNEEAKLASLKSLVATFDRNNALNTQVIEYYNKTLVPQLMQHYSLYFNSESRQESYWLI